MLHLNTLGVDVFIKRYSNLLQDSFWNNYDLIIWEKNASGYFDVNGMYHKDSWGTFKTFILNENGSWRLPKKYVKYLK
jgi:hypothetical protein